MWENFKEFWAQPFRSDMDAVNWFLFLGLLIAIMILWGVILRHLKEIA